MIQESNRQDVAVFVDFENVYISVRDKFDANPNFETIMERCTELGRIVIARAYADWYRYPRITSALYANGIDPIYVPTYHYTKETGRTGSAIKNSADMHLCIDAMKTLFTHANIVKYVFITGDRDFIPLVNSVRQQGKDVIIIGIGGAASTHLAQSADEFIFYEQLIGKRVPVSRSSSAASSDKLESAADADIYDTLVQAVHLVRERGYVSTLGSLKLVMKELMGGDFKESRYKDLKGRPFTKFKDFVLDAEKRGKVQIYTSGTVNEVFLPGEDAAKLSQFSDVLKDETGDINYSSTTTSNGREQGGQSNKSDQSTASTTSSSSTSSSSRSRRRRRPARKSQNGDNGGAEKVAAEKAEKKEQVPRAEETPDTAETTPDGEPVPEATPALDEAQEMAGERAEAEAHEQERYTPEAVWNEGTPDTLFTSDDVQYEPDVEPLRDEQQILREWERARSLAMEHQTRSLEEVDKVFASVSNNEDHSPVDEEELFAKVQALITPPDDTELPDSIIEAGGATDATDTDAAAPDEPTMSADEPVQMSMPEEPATEHEAQATDSVEHAAPVEQETAPPQPETAATTQTQQDASDQNEEVVFSDEDWRIFCIMMAEFSKPVSFGHIFDALRERRNKHELSGTNEQLRTMIKQAINKGLLDRSGRGMRIYYTLAETVSVE
jgi:uncharacterized protein (TIGR00288 family)